MNNPSMRRTRFKWSEAFVVLLAFFGTFPAIPAPIHALSLDTSLGRILYICSLIALGGSSLIASHRERARQESEQFERDERDAETQKLILAIHTNTAPTTTTTTTTAAPESPKRRLLKLSNEILEFLLARQQAGPSMQMEDRPALMRYTGETMALYASKFGVRVMAERDALLKAYPDNTALQGLLLFATNTTGARIVAENLGALAHQMSD